MTSSTELVYDKEYLQPPRFDTHNFVKPVHVELSDEGGHVGMLVVIR